ncbi:MAG: GIY-YIG nuclease family protein [Planctomycetes bacterium]|nr:GIY-YIG nuclease family protein [Planctomycetota bacterium]
MKFWNDELRICPKCRASVRMPDEGRLKCPKCHAPVWFFNYRPLAPPPDIPEPRAVGFWKNPTTALLLLATSIFAIVALVGVFQTLLVAAVSALAAVGFAVFAFVRHQEASQIEAELAHADEIRRYAETLRDRVQEVTARYQQLLRTGDARVEHYYKDIYSRAEQEREQAELLRQRAGRDREAIRSVEHRIYAMAERLIHDHLKWTAAKLRPDPENYQRRRNDLQKAFDFAESVGYSLPAGLRNESLTRLKEDYKRIVYEHSLREEQKLMKQQMREEERVRREREAALRAAEQREREIERRLQEVLREHRSTHDAEVEELRRQLQEAQASSERAMSMAQLTKAGHVYVLSNIGSFGEEIFKVGMTRRLIPAERVKELGDASVPFPFDVHAMITCDDAPNLERALHRHLSRYRVNRINLRKEYFRVGLQTILDIVRSHHGEVEYVAEAEALEYRESSTVSPEDLVEFESELAEMGVQFEDLDE